MRLKLRFPCLACLLILLLPVLALAQQLTLSGLRAQNNQGAFHGLKQDAAGNLYTLFEAGDGVRVLEFNAAGTALLAQTQIGQAGDSGIALDIDSAGYVYVTGTSNSLGSLIGAAGTAYPNRADTTTNSFLARFTPGLALQWLTFLGSGRMAATAVATNGSSVYVTGGIYAATLPVTSGGIQQSPATGSNGNGFVEAFNAASGTLQYSTYLTGANGDTSPAAIAADASGNTWIAGSTTAAGYPTTAALVPTFRSAGTVPVSGFLTKLTPAGDGFIFSTFVPGAGFTSIALDTGSNSLLMSGNIAPGLFPLTAAQAPIAPLLSYQAVVRMGLDGSSVLSSTLIAPATDSVVAAGPSGTAWIFASQQDTPAPPLLPVAPLETLGNAFAARVNSGGQVDRAARFGGLPVNNSSYASLPALEGGIVINADGTVALSGSVTPTLSSALLSSEHYDLPLAQAPNAALPSAVRDALPPGSCTGSACSGSAGLLARLAPDAVAPQLALSTDDLPNLTLRNLGTADALGLQITAAGYAFNSGCDTTLAAGAECGIALTGAAAGSITVSAANFTAFTTALPATARIGNAIAVTPHELDFGIQTSGSATGTRTLTIRNLTSMAQTFTSAIGTNVVQAYTLAESSSTCPATGTTGTQKTVAPGASCTITLGLKANASSSKDGAISDRWQVGGNDILVTGYGQAADVSLSATTIDFGRQFVDGLRSPRFLYLSNSSDTARAHTALFSTNPVFTLTDECPALLQPRSTCRIALGYNAATAPSSDALSLAIDGMSAVLLGETLPPPAIGGASVNPNLTVSAAQVSFSTPVTATTVSAETHTVVVSNRGAAAFALALAATGDFSFTTDCAASLSGNSACNVVVRFTPSAGGTRQGLLSVTAGSASPAYVALAGTGISVLPANNGLEFGDVPVNTPVVQWLKVSGALVSATASSADDSFKVILVEDTGFGHGQPVASAFAATAAGTCLNCYLGIQFMATSVGRHVATVSLSSAAGGKATTVMVSGSGVAANGLALTPLVEEFGPVPVHTSSASTIFQLTNATGASVTVTSASLTGDFLLSTDLTGGAACAAGAVVPAGGACFLPVQFLPTAVGTRSGTLTVQTSAGASSTILSGTGADDPGISFTPGELRFDNVPGSSATQQTITVTNTGSIAETIGAPVSSDAHFTAVSSCGTLPTAGTCSIAVSYTPTAALSSGNLSIPVTTAPAGAPTTATYLVALSGLYPEDSSGIQIIPGEHTAVSFASAATDAPAASRVLHVNNLTATQMTVNVTMPRQFALTGNTCGSLAANGSCDLTVQYTPLTASDVTGTLIVQGTPADGSAPRSGLGYLEGYGNGSGSLAITGNFNGAGVVDFGQVNSGQSTSQTLTLTYPVGSPAASTVTVRRIRVDTPFASTTTCGQPLAPGQSCAVTVSYAPVYQVANTSVSTSRTDNGAITIESDGLTSPQFVDLTGTTAPVVVTAPANTTPIATFTTSQGSLTFPATAVGSVSTAQTVQLTNTGNATVHVLKVIAPAGFGQTNDCAILTAGAVCTISVTFQPQTSGASLASLAIQTDGVTSLEMVSLLGTSSAPSAGTPTAALTPLSLSFGRVLVGRTASQTATLTNTGTVPITLGSVAVAGADFSLASASTAANACPAAGNALPPGASCTIAVLFSPSGTGTIRGLLSVTTSAGALPLTVALSGVGTQPQLTVTPTSLDFGNVVVGSSAALSLTLRNVSTLPVDGLAFTATGGFSVSSTCGITTLNASSTCSVTVTYQPTAVGPSSGVVTIASTDPSSPIQVPLTGTAIQGGNFILTVNGGSSGSASVQQGIPATYTLSVTPTNGYSGVVALTCTPDAVVAYATCSVLPSTVNLTTGAQNSTVTITTVSAVATAALQRPYASSHALAALCMMPAIALLASLRRRRIAALLLLALATFSLDGCGGGGDPRIRYTGAGTYSYHVTASSTNGIPATQTVALQLVVTPKS